MILDRKNMEIKNRANLSTLSADVKVVTIAVI